MKYIYIYGDIGNAGTKILIKEKYIELEKHFTRQYLNIMYDKLCDGENTPSLFISGVNEREEFKYVLDNIFFNKIYIDHIAISKGGALSALWEITERNKIGIEYNMSLMPIRQEVVEITNFLNINPYRLYTSNSYILILNKDIHNEDVFNSINGMPINIFKKFILIGNSINLKKKIRIDNETKSFLTKDYKDELETLLPKYFKNNKIS